MDNRDRPVPETQTEDSEIDLLDYSRVLWRHRWWILLITLAFVAIGFFVNFLRTPMYSATATVSVKWTKVGTPEVPTLSFPTLKALIETPPVADRLVKECELDRPPLRQGAGELLSHLALQQLPDTNIVLTRVELPDSAAAARVANRLAELVEEAADSFGREEEQEGLSVLEARSAGARHDLDRIGAEMNRLGIVFKNDTATTRDGRLVPGIEAEYRVAQEIYIESAKRLIEGRLRAETTARAKVVEKAVPSRTPIPRNTKRTVVMVSVAGLALSILGALVFAGLTGHRVGQ
jgi:capsular polysaccharide biosynthesis protein